MYEITAYIESKNVCVCVEWFIYTYGHNIYKCVCVYVIDTRQAFHAWERKVRKHQVNCMSLRETIPRHVQSSYIHQCYSQLRANRRVHRSLNAAQHSPVYIYKIIMCVCIASTEKIIKSYACRVWLCMCVCTCSHNLLFCVSVLRVQCALIKIYV